MIEPKKAVNNVLAFVPPAPSMEGKLERWFRGIVQSNLDLMTALERLSDSYRTLLGDTPLTERDEAVLQAVEITLNNARNAQTL